MHLPSLRPSSRMLIIGSLLLLWPMLTSQLSAQATTVAPKTPLVPRGTAIVLPKYDVPTPTEQPGGHIELHLPASYVDIWTEVQWLDGEGNWHQVDGWRGFTDNRATVRWYVSRNDFGKGPFRWQVFLFEEGDLIDSSALFFLPKAGDETIKINLQLPDLEQFLDEGFG